MVPPCNGGCTPTLPVHFRDALLYTGFCDEKSMDFKLRAPRNRTAELQLILRLVSQGYTLWTADQIPLSKLQGFIAKWSNYRLFADPAARAYRKKTGRANTHLVLEHIYNGLDTDESPQALVDWMMLGTPGRDGLGAGTAIPGPVLDATNKAQRIEWQGYQLTRQAKYFKTADGTSRREVTWTWRLPGQRYAEYEALLIESAKKRDYPALNQIFGVLCSLPMFAGIRAQVFRLNDETNRMLKKMGGSPMPSLDLPFITMQPIWRDQ